MALLKMLLGFCSGGGLLGFIAASIIAPKFLRWYNAPAMGQALCDCIKVTDEITSRMLKMQGTGAAIGAVLFLILGVVFEVRRKKKAVPVASS